MSHIHAARRTDASPAVPGERHAADVCNQLLKLDSLACELCRRTARLLSARAWQQRLREFEEDHRRHARYLAHLVFTAGGQPDWRYGEALADDALAAGSSDREILEDVERHLVLISRRYEVVCEYLERLAPPALPELREILRRSRQDLRQHLNWLAAAQRAPDA